MDAFTESLLARTRARSENLAKKMNQSQVSPRKRRAPLTEANSLEKNEKKVHFEASPVKPTLQASDVKPDTPAIPSVRSRMSKLADMRREWSAVDGSELDSPQNVPAPKPRQQELELTPGPASAPSARKSRFAALAASISSWEDDLDHPKHEFHHEEKPQSRKWERPKPEGEPSSECPQSTKDITSNQPAGPKKPARNVRFEDEEEETNVAIGNGQGKAQIRSLPGDSLGKESSSSTDQEQVKPEAKAELRSLPTGSPAKPSAYSRLMEQKQEAGKSNSTTSKSVVSSLKDESSAPGSSPARKRIQVSLSRERESSRMELQKHLTQEQHQPTPKPRAPTTSTVTTTTQQEKKPSTKRLAPQPAESVKKQATAPSSGGNGKKEPGAGAASNVKAYFGRHKTSAALPSVSANNINKVEPRVGAMAKSIQDRLRQHQENWHGNDINKKIQEQRKKELDVIKQRWNHSSATDEATNEGKQEKEEPTPVPRVAIVRKIPDEPEDKEEEEEEEEEEEDLDPMEVTEDTINIGMVESPPTSDESFESQEAVAESATAEGGPATPLPPPREKPAVRAAAQQEAGPATPFAPPRPRRTNSKVLAEEEAKAQQEALTKHPQQESSQEDSDADDEYDDEDDVQELDITDVFGDIDDLLNEAEQAMESEETATPAPAQQQKQLATPQASAQKPPTSNLARPQPSTSQSPNLYSIESFRKQGPKSPLATTSFIRSDSGTVGAGQGVKPMALKPIPVKKQIQTLIEEVSAQQSVIYQTSQALNLIATNAEYRGSRQEVEAERLLVIAAQRRQACLAEIQRLKTPAIAREPSIRQTSDGEAMKACKGFVTIQDIRLPLKTEYVLSTKQDRMNHYFFLLLRCREHVLATRIQTTAEDIAGDCLPFTNTAKFNNLDSDFVIEVFIFEMQNKRPKSEDKSKQTFFSGLTPKKLLANMSKDSRQGMKTPSHPSPGGPGSMRSSNFTLVGATRLGLQSCRVKRFTLCKVPFNSPLEGTVHLNMSCHTNTNVTESGWLTMFDDISGFGAWHRRWCVLGGGYISYWKYPDDEKHKAPNGSVDLRQCITSQVALISRILCARPNTFELITQQPSAKTPRQGKDTLVTKHENSTVLTKHMLSADVKEDRIRWIDSLNRTLLDLRTWNRDTSRPSSY